MDKAITSLHGLSLYVNISDTMSLFKVKAGKALNLDLSGYSVWFLSQKKLEDFSTLQDLCGAYSGVVQIVFVLRPADTITDSKIDIIEVLKSNQATLLENEEVAPKLPEVQVGCPHQGYIYYQDTSVATARLRFIPEDSRIEGLVKTSSKDGPERIIKSHLAKKPQNQLWQFLLELLSDYQAMPLISWVDDSGEFKFHQPEVVARMWGEHKGKNNMTFCTLSRSLRYYSEPQVGILRRIPKKRYSYKFEMDLKDILGYSPLEIQEQMEHAKVVQDQALNATIQR